MAVLSSIRKRSALLVAIIFIALAAFVLGDLFSSRNAMFFSSENEIGIIAGNKITFQQFDYELKTLEERQKERSRETALDEQTIESINNSVWEKFVNDLVMKKEYEETGFSCSDEELAEMILGNDPDPSVVQSFTDPKTGKVVQRFSDSLTGKLNPAAVKKYVSEISDDEKHDWTQFEDGIRETRIRVKYFNLLKKGIFVTDMLAKEEYISNKKKVSAKFVLKDYKTISDSTITVNEAELLKYYNENQNKFKTEDERKVNYVVFDIQPSAQDIVDQKNAIDKIAEEFRVAENDSSFVSRESDNPTPDINFYSKGKLNPVIDSLAFNSPAGTVFPVYMDNNMYKVAKLIAINENNVDSAKVRHLLISTQGNDTLKAKARIDSIKSVVVKKKNFSDMAKKFSQDPGSGKDGGDMPWFKEGQMVPEFQKASFEGKKGDLTICKSQYGYHLIEIMENPAKSKRVQVAVIERAIEPSSKTRQDFYRKAIDFAGKYTTAESFDKGVEELSKTMRVEKRTADKLKAADKTIQGLENPREMVRWAFNEGTKIGMTRQEPFLFGKKYVVAAVADVTEKGIAPLEKVKQQVEIGAKKEKKAQIMTAEFEKAMSGAKTLEEVAGKMKLTAETESDITYAMYSGPKIGREQNAWGVLFGMKQGAISKPVKGEKGVFVLYCERITEAEPTKDYKQSADAVKQNYTYRTENEVEIALKEKASITDNRAKFY